MNRRRTGIIALASILKTVVLAGPGFAIVARNPGINGALLATVLIMVGGSVETAVVALRARRLHGEMARAAAAGDGRLASDASSR